MSASRLPVLLAWMLLLVPSGSTASAQICAGRQTFNAAPAQVGVGTTLSPSSREVSGSAGAGTNRLFGIASVRARSEQGDWGHYGIDGLIGTDQPLTADNRMHACPVLGAGYGWRPGGSPLHGAGGLTATAGLRASLLAINSRKGAVLPTVVLQFARLGGPRDGRRSEFTAGGGIGVILPGGLGVETEFRIELRRSSLDPRVLVGGSYGF